MMRWPSDVNRAPLMPPAAICTGDVPSPAPSHMSSVPLPLPSSPSHINRSPVGEYWPWYTLDSPAALQISPLPTRIGPLKSNSANPLPPGRKLTALLTPPVGHRASTLLHRSQNRG